MIIPFDHPHFKNSCPLISVQIFCNLLEQLLDCFKKIIMEEPKIIAVNDIDEAWAKIASDLGLQELVMEYNTIIDMQHKKVLLQIDIDPGGGFESGYQTTRFSSHLEDAADFKFALHHQGFIDEIGKFLGMQDVTIGFPEFDKRVIVKTNDDKKVISILQDESVRNVLQDLSNFNFHITTHHVDDSKIPDKFLELNIEEGITDPVILRKIFDAFCSVLFTIDDN